MAIVGAKDNHVISIILLNSISISIFNLKEVNTVESC